MDKYPQQQQNTEQLLKKINHLTSENNYLRKQLEQKKNDHYKNNYKQNQQKKDDMHEKYITQRYALKLAYFGQNYTGLQKSQGIIESTNSIEDHIYKAFEKTCLVKDINKSNYQRSGRTDKGVSALGNVISLDIRTSIKQGQDPLKEKNKLNYVKMLNGCLPDDIRFIAQAKTPDNFNARYDTKSRIYKYFFMIDNMDIERIKEASKLLIGKHDFRNFCKIDVISTTHYVRDIFQINFETINEQQQDPRLNIYCITIQVGKNIEDISVINDLLNPSKFKGRPLYLIADENPLILYDCCYENIQWEYENNATTKLYDHLKNLYQKKFCEAQLISISLSYILNNNKDVVKISQNFENDFHKRKYKKIEKLQQCHSYEQIIDNLKGKKLEKYQNKIDQRNQNIQNYEQEQKDKERQQQMDDEDDDYNE